MSNTSPQVKLLDSYCSSNPEELVCMAARNDYREDGLIDEEGEMYSLDNVMSGADYDDDILEDLKEERRKEGPDDESGHGVELDLGEDSVLKKHAKQRTLINHLMRSGHWGPFEHPQAVIYIGNVSRVVMAQITRHRQFSFDIKSLRYVGVDDGDVEDTFQVPECTKEGEAVVREGVQEIEAGAESKIKEAYEVAFDHYRDLIDMGVPQEEARKVLPMGTKVNIVMSGNARAWMHLLNIRGKADVQREARETADAIGEELCGWMEYSFERYLEDELPRALNP